MTITPAIQDAINQAKSSEAVTGLPWEITISQWALESGWGAHSPGNNPFGIKAYPHAFGVQYLQTKEFVNGQWFTRTLPFATFATLGDAFIKHAELITRGQPYQKPWQAWQADANRTPQSLAKLIGPIYATDPNYAEQLIAVMASMENALAGVEHTAV